MDSSKELEDLKNYIIKCCYWYYVKAQPLIQDQEFDSLFRKLRELELVYGTTPDSPTQKIYGDLESQYGNFVELERISEKSKFNTAKIVISWNCTLDCWYCCNKQKSIKKTFKPITQQEIERSNYQDYELTGGEVILPPYFSILGTLCRQNIPKGRNIYVYSNGTYSLSNVVYGEILKSWGVTGLNIGYHGIPLAWDSLQKINEFLPIRLLVKKDEMNEFLNSLGFEIKLWELEDCDTITTDRFYLKFKK